MSDYNIYRAVMVPQVDRKTQETVQVNFEAEARKDGAEISHERTFEKDGKWRGEVFIVCTEATVRELRRWKEVKRIAPAK